MLTSGGLLALVPVLQNGKSERTGVRTIAFKDAARARNVHFRIPQQVPQVSSCFRQWRLFYK